MNFNILSNCPLFKGLKPDEIESTLKTVTFQRKTYEKDYVIANLGEDCNRLIIILRGEVRGEMADKSGKTIKIEDLKAPSPLASAFIFGQQNNFPVNITTNTETEILIIQREELLSLFQSNKAILTNFLTLISTRAQFLTQKIKFLSFGTIKGKLAHYILSNIGDTLHSFPMTKTQQQLADLFGIQRPSLARALKELQEDEIIVIKQKTITVLNKEKLKELIH